MVKWQGDPPIFRFDLKPEAVVEILNDQQSKLEALADENKRLRKALADIHNHMPYLKDGETRKQYNARIVDEMRGMAYQTLTMENDG